jgi:hypothetical protein
VSYPKQHTVHSDALHAPDPAECVYEMRADPRTRGHVEETVTFDGRGQFHLGARVRFRSAVAGNRVGVVRSVHADGTVVVDLDGAAPYVQTRVTIRTGECPCGGTWGVCAYHGGPRT